MSEQNWTGNTGPIRDASIDNVEVYPFRDENGNQGYALSYEDHTAAAIGSEESVIIKPTPGECCLVDLGECL
jgi:hypothetical protein